MRSPAKFPLIESRRLLLGMVALTALMLRTVSSHGQAWNQLRDPRAAGWDTGKLAAAHRMADSLGATAVVVVHRGVVIAAWGEVARPIALASVRKSLMITLYGAEIQLGGLDLDATLGSLGITDHEPLDSVESTARVRDLLSARSGVYRPAAQEGESWASRRPARGAHRPGEEWFYNNWSFNLVGTVYEIWRRQSPYDGFLASVARPLGMEDYGPLSILRFREPSRSLHAAHAFRLSARDLARVGQLYVNDGRWGGRQLLLPGWRDSVTTLRTDWGNGSGYGWLWWINPTRGPYYRSRPSLDSLETIAALGAGGQAVVVAAKEELVIVYLVDRERGPDLPEEHAFAVAEAVISARPGQHHPMTTGPLAAVPFPDNSPGLARPITTPPSAEQMQQLSGDYDVGNGLTVRVWTWEGGLFVTHPRLGDLELLRVEQDRFIDVGLRIRVEFTRDAQGRGMDMSVHLPNGTVTAKRH